MTPLRSLSPAAARACRKIRRARQNQPRLFFESSPGLRAFMADGSSRICVVAANRVGKTYQAIAKLALAMIARPGIRCRIVGPTAKRVNRVHGRYLAHFLRGQLASGSTYNPGTGFNAGNMAICKNGSTCELMSYQQDPAAHASDSMHLVLLDEPPPPAHFTEAEARVFDTDGAVWVTLTAVGRPVKWLKDVVKQGIADREQGRGEGWSFYQLALTTDNCPWYTEEQIAERRRQVARTPWEYEQRINGAWDGVSEGRRFVGFGDAHLLPLTTGARTGWPGMGAQIHLALAADHGEGAGHSVWVLFGWQVLERTAYGPRVYVRALAWWTNPTRMSVRKEAAEVRKMVQSLGTERAPVDLHNVAFGVGDTNVASKSETARTLNEAFEAEFARLMKIKPEHARLRMRPAKKGPDSINSGVATCNDLFDTEVAPKDGAPVPALQVSEACVGVVEALRHWSGKDDDLKHAADAFRYGVTMILSEVGWEPARLLAA